MTGSPTSPGRQNPRTAEEIERDLAATRQQLGATAEALGARLDVKRRTKDWAGEKKARTEVAARHLTHGRGRAGAIASVAVVALVGLVVWKGRRQ